MAFCIVKHSPQFLKLVDDSKTRIREISVDEVVKKLKSGEKFYFVDVREDSEWDQGRAKGSIHIGRGVLERDVENRIPDPASAIILYCGGGFRSALAADNLQKMGYRNVQSMSGGWRGWLEAGAPTEK